MRTTTIHGLRIGWALAGILMVVAFGAPARAEFIPRDLIRGMEPAEPLSPPKELTDALDAAAEPLERAHAHLALANWWVSTAPARPATRWLVSMEDASDRQALVDAATQARQHLEQVRALLKEDAEARPDEAKDRRRRLKSAADTIQPFAEIFHNADRTGDTEADREAWHKASRGLAVARESEDKQVAAAALLWQAFAFNKSGRRDRALEALPEALAKPEHLPYSFMSRVLRCRLMAEAGQTSAAVFLLSRMDAELKKWMTGQNRNRARRLVGLVQYEIVTNWMSELKSATQPFAPDQFDSLLGDIEASFTQVKNPQVYYMPTAVPPDIAPEFKLKARSTTTTREEDQRQDTDGDAGDIADRKDAEEGTTADEN